MVQKTSALISKDQTAERPYPWRTTRLTGVGGFRRLLSGSPDVRLHLKGMRTLGLSVDVEAKQHDILGLVETITKYLAERPTLEKYQPLIVKGAFLWK
jgi:hypothetical protein